MQAGDLPEELGTFNIDINEMMFTMYMPVKMAGDNKFYVPPRLSQLKEVLEFIARREALYDRYVYVTCKHTYVTPTSMSNRPGWHIDGFGTDDINYIWYDCVPTEFCHQNFLLSDNDAKSLEEMADQAREKNIVVFPNKTLLRLRGTEVHRVSENSVYGGLRTFVKISLSRHKYNLVGNARNYLIDYDWKMYSRSELRNMEHNGDFYESKGS